MDYIQEFFLKRGRRRSKTGNNGEGMSPCFRIFLDSRLNFKEHILTRIKKAIAMIGVVARNFRYMLLFAYVRLNR